MLISPSVESWKYEIFSVDRLRIVDLRKSLEVCLGFGLCSIIKFSDGLRH
jgi:hypothetical protein